MYLPRIIICCVYVLVAIPLYIETVSMLREPGDFVIDAFIPVHTCKRNCSIFELNSRGIQQLEALLYALDIINTDNSILSNNVSIGFEVTDATNVTKLYYRVLREYNTDGDSSSDKSKIDVIVDGMIEPREATDFEHNFYLDLYEHVIDKFRIPQISYASTGIDLSDKSRFEYFSRVVPPDTYQAQAMVDVVKAFNWTYVSTLADSGNYGEKGIDTFKKLADKHGICISTSIEIPREPNNDTFRDIITKLRKNGKAKVVVMFVNEDNCEKLVKTFVDMGLTNELYWLASDSWGAKEVPVRGQESAAEGTVTILPQREVIKEFDAYFTKLNPTDNYRNPWFREFWEKHFKCSLEGDAYPKRCTGREKLSAPGYQQEGIVPFVIDAVYAIAHALNNMLIKECHGPEICKDMDPPDGQKLLQYIRNVSFTGVAHQTIKFNKDGDAMGRYTIYQFQKRHTGRYEYVPIGNWSDSLTIDMSLTKWKPEEVALPRSVCSEPCPPGHRKHNDDSPDKCCWACIRCDNHMILRDMYTCESCPNGTYPDHTQSMCYTLPIDYMALNSIWAIVPVVVASFGILATLFVIAVFIKFNSTPVIMASGRELCYVLMTGLLLSYIMTFVMVAKPSMTTCCLTRVGLGLSLSMCYAALFTKTNRISRIFNRGVKAMVQRPSYTSPKSQLVICFCLVSVQIIGAITWVGMDLPDIALVYPDRKTVVLRCKSTNIAIVLSLLYNMILITLCTIYAFKTRKIPENFNEAKHIAFTMYSTCIVWLAFIPIYFGTHKSDFRIQITALCMCVSISATVALACLFVPKIYIVLFQPHKNVRQGAKGSIGSGLQGRPLFGRPSTRFTSLAAMNGDIASPSNVPMRLLSNESTCTVGTFVKSADSDVDAPVFTFSETSEQNNIPG